MQNSRWDSLAWRWLLLPPFLALLAACRPPQPATTQIALTDDATPLIVEVMAGVEGNNNYEFIELHNPSSHSYDLNNLHLVYRLATSREDVPVFEWDQPALIPAGGFYLLVRRQEDIGATANDYFDQSINSNGGGVALLDSEGAILDSVAWGNAPESMTTGRPAPALIDGASLQRRLLDNGEFLDDGDDRDQFALASQPDPQNSGSPPLLGQPGLKVTLSNPAQVAAGSIFSLSAAVENTSEQTLSGVSFALNLPAGFELQQSAPEVQATIDGLAWTIGELGAGQVVELGLDLRAPWEYQSALLANARAETEGFSSFAGPSWIQVAEGTIPIRIARDLHGQEVIVEGVASIYTGGLFAGAGNTKFYMEDETGGVQVWVPEGEGELEVDIGQLVRVRGLIEPYRGTIELIVEPPGNAEILSQAPAELEAQGVPLTTILTEPQRLAGELLRVEGTLTRVEEFNYSYELDLSDEQGQVLTAYVDKLTGMQVETLAIDQRYGISGILETPDGVPTLYPRTEQDLVQLRPRGLLLDLSAPANIPRGEEGEVRITLTNNSADPQEELSLTLSAPENGAVMQIYPEPTQRSPELVWTELSLQAGQSLDFTIELTPLAGSELLKMGPASVLDRAAEAKALLEPFEIVIGETVPVAAVQGHGLTSPFVLNQLTVEGVVTGVFPALGGAWLQSVADDGDATTSEGIFLNLGGARSNLSQGDLIRVFGRVREISGQTQLEIDSLADIQLLATGRPLPEPVSLDPPQKEESAEAYYEKLEGMLVALTESAVAIGPTNRYGEIPVVLAKHGQIRLTHQDEGGHRIILDDGSNLVHGDQSTLSQVVYSGDLLEGAAGPLAYTFGQFKIEPILPPVIEGSERPPVEPLSEQPSAFTVATWNVENLFDILEPHPSDPPRPRLADYERDLEGVAATMEYLGWPDVVALQEVENLAILQDLVGLPEVAGRDYQPYLMEGTDSRGIDVGYLVRADKLDVLEVRQLEVAEDLLSRPPLLLIIELAGSDGPTRLGLINNHFTSMSAGVEATEPRRMAQAQLNANAAEALLAEGTVDEAIILGDLNSFFHSAPIDSLRSSGFQHVLADTNPAERYDYIYQGITQTLDHILVSAALADCLAGAEILHVNADYPPPDLAAPPLIASSDHDPVRAIFTCW